MGKKRPSIGGGRKIDRKPLFCCLRYSINFFPSRFTARRGGLKEKSRSTNIVASPENARLLSPVCAFRAIRQLRRDRHRCDRHRRNQMRRSPSEHRQSALGIERHPRPIVRRAAGLPGIPSAKCHGQIHRDAEWCETTSAAFRFERRRLECRRRRGESLGVAAADDQQVFVNDGWTGQIYRHRAGGFRPRFSRRSIRPSSPKDAIGLPVVASSAYTKFITPTRMRLSCRRPSKRARGRLRSTHSGVNFHNGLPSRHSNAKIFVSA